MGILRVEKNSNYSVISNVHLQDTSLSWKSKGILSYLLSKPDDWQIYLAHLQNQSTDGRDSTRTGIIELISAGYIAKDFSRNKAGQIIGRDYIVREKPVMDKPKSDKPRSDNPMLDNPTLLKTEVINDGFKLNTDDEPSPPDPPPQPEPKPVKKSPSPSPSNNLEKPKAPPAAETHQSDIEKAIAILCLLIPEEMRKPSVVARVAKAVADGIAVAAIEEAILFTNDKSDRKTVRRYQGHLGNSIDKGWAVGYEPEVLPDPGPSIAAREKAAIKGRLELPLPILRDQAKAGDQYAIKALEIIKKE